MRKLAYVLAIAVLVPPGLVAAWLALWWCTTTNTASVNIYNRSRAPLNKVVISVPGRQAIFDSLAVSEDSAAFPAEPHFTFDVRLPFDTADGHHILSGCTHILPFGDTVVSVSVDDQLKLSVSGKPTFMYR